MLSTSSSNQTARLPPYLSLSEGLAELGITKANFFYYVRTGQIRRDPSVKTRPTRYNTQDILAIREKRQQRRQKQSGKSRKTPTRPAIGVIDWVHLNDMPNILKLVFAVFGEDYPGGIDRSIAWLRRNPQLTLAAFVAQDRTEVLAYLTLLPLPEEVILEMLRQGQRPATIQAEKIETYERTGTYVLFAESIVAHPKHPEQITLLLRHWMRFWCDRYPERQVEKIYAQATNQQSDILIQKLFFAPRYDLAENAFVLDLRRPGASQLVRRFQQCLVSKQAQSVPGK